jgi:hypothetical protein
VGGRGRMEREREREREEGEGGKEGREGATATIEYGKYGNNN